MIFLVSSGKMIFLFPEKKILFFRWKTKDDLSQKKKWMEISYILQILRKDRLSQKYALEYDLSYIMRKDIISFSPKYDFLFFTDGKWKMIFLKQYMEIWCFLYVCKGGISFSYKYEINLKKKKAKMIFSRKIHLKMRFPALLKTMIFILEKMILVFFVLLWRPFWVFSYIAFQ